MILCAMAALKAAEFLLTEAALSSNGFARVGVTEEAKVEECDCVYKHIEDTSFWFLKITGGSFSWEAEVRFSQWNR